MVSYRYELRSGAEMLATGHLTTEQPLQVGQSIDVNGGAARVVSIDPMLGERELRAVFERE